MVNVAKLEVVAAAPAVSFILFLDLVVLFRLVVSLQEELVVVVNSERQQVKWPFVVLDNMWRVTIRGKKLT